MKGRLLLSFVSLKSGTVLALLKRWSLDHIFPFCGSQNKIILVVVVQSLSCPTLHGLWSPARLLCAWDSPGKNAGVGCHFLLQGIFSTQRSNPHLLLGRQMHTWILNWLHWCVKNYFWHPWHEQETNDKDTQRFLSKIISLKLGVFYKAPVSRSSFSGIKCENLYVEWIQPRVLPFSLSSFYPSFYLSGLPKANRAGSPLLPSYSMSTTQITRAAALSKCMKSKSPPNNQTAEAPVKFYPREPFILVIFPPFIDFVLLNLLWTPLIPYISSWLFATSAYHSCTF